MTAPLVVSEIKNQEPGMHYLWKASYYGCCLRGLSWVEFRGNRKDETRWSSTGKDAQIGGGVGYGREGRIGESLAVRGSRD